MQKTSTHCPQLALGLLLLLGSNSYSNSAEEWRTGSCQSYLRTRPSATAALIVLEADQWIPRAPPGKIYILRAKIHLAGAAVYLYQQSGDRIETKENSPIKLSNYPSLPDGYRYEIQSSDKPASGGEVLKIKHLNPFPRAGREQEKLTPIEAAYVHKEVGRVAMFLFYVIRESGTAERVREMERIIQESLLLVEQLPISRRAFAELLLQIWKPSFSNEEIELTIIEFMGFKNLIP